jgi:hypothetical protein
VGATDTVDPQTRQEMLEEFKALRAEILVHQTHRTTVLGFTMAVCGVAGSVAGGLARESETVDDAVRLNVIASVLSLALVALVVALILTSGKTQSIDRLASYIRLFIEPSLPGINWETVWDQHRSIGQRAKKKFGVSKQFALAYLILILALVSVAVAVYLASPVGVRGVLLFAVAPALVAAVLAIDLWRRSLPWWRSVLTPQHREQYFAALKPPGANTAIDVTD